MVVVLVVDVDVLVEDVVVVVVGGAVVVVLVVDVLVVVVVVGAQEGHVAGDVQDTLGRHK